MIEFLLTLLKLFHINHCKEINRLVTLVDICVDSFINHHSVWHNNFIYLSTSQVNMVSTIGVARQKVFNHARIMAINCI